jgi:hypothetical protein
MKEVLPRLSLAGNLEKPLMSLYGTECRDVAVDSVKNLRKVRTECTVGGGGGEREHNTVYLDDGLKILQNN